MLNIILFSLLALTFRAIRKEYIYHMDLLIDKPLIKMYRRRILTLAWLTTLCGAAVIVSIISWFASI